MKEHVGTTSRRRGGAFVFVLGVCLIVTVLGMGAVRLASVSGRTTNDANDWELARSLAFSAAEHAISVVNTAASANPTGWRAAYTSGQTAYTQTLGRGTISWALKDEFDGNLQGDYGHAFRIYGIGRAGNVTRVYSVQVMPGGAPLDVLRTAVHSGGNLSLGGTSQAVNGPFSSNATVSLSGTVKGAIEAKSTTGSASGTQAITTAAPTKAMPSPGIFNTLLQSATVIDYAALGGGKLDSVLLSPASNPYGAPNSNGVYAITVPNTKTLTIVNCRIVGTLLINGTGVHVNCQGPVLWETGPTNLPILVMSSSGGDITLAGKSTWLSESAAGTNFNPAATPFGGVSNANKTDDFPPQYRGLMHVMVGSGGQVNLNGNAYLVGTLIADCLVKTGNQTTSIQDPAIYAHPPTGYCVGDVMTELPGTWRWDTLP